MTEPAHVGRAGSEDRYDVVVAGASIAGCAAARHFALAGARVALVERRPDPGAYKVVCTHQFQPSAIGAIERLGLAPLLERAGAARTRAAAWSPYGGWIRTPADAPRAYGVTRRRLDPILRELAVETAGLDTYLGRTVVGLLRHGGRVAGVEVETPDGERRALRARLTVAADGRDSTLARLARVPARVLPHNRFFYFAYWHGVRTPPDEARLWFLEPDGAACFPNEDGLTVVVASFHKRRLAEFRADPEGAYAELVAEIPDGPGLEDAERASKLIGKLEMPNKLRSPARPGLAFVGDAALAADPLFGVGCGWALETAEWLADAAAPAVAGGGDLDRALGRYRGAFRRRLVPHHLQMSGYSTGRPMRLSERIAFRAAARDPVVGAAFEEFATRRTSPLRMLDPRLLPRTLRAGLSRGA